MTTREGLYKEIFRLLVASDVEVSDPILHRLATFTTFLCEGAPARLTNLSDALDLPTIQPEAKEQTVRRFLSSPKISAEQTLEARILLVLPLLLPQREIVLVMDRTEWEKRKKKVQILTVWLCFEGRALPLFWLTANRKGNTSFSTWQDLLRPLLEALQRLEELASHTITVVADREFASPRLVHWLAQEWDVYSVVRCKRSAYIQAEDAPAEQLAAVLERIKRGETHWFDSVLLTQQATKPVSVCITWREDCEEPLIVASSLDNPKEALARYAQRFGTEPMDKDCKSNGFDLQRTKVTDAKRIDTLMILCAFSMIILSTLGLARENAKQTRKKKPSGIIVPTRGLFMEGRRWLEQVCRKLSPRDFARTIKELFQRLWKT
jgi:hypothetical protein